MVAEKPDVSFVMSVYNGEAFLEETLDSIEKQTFPNWECVVMDDCSTDRTPEILARWAGRDPRFRVFRNPENLRLAASLNRGLGLARGRYAARVDADDICLPDRLEKQVAFMDGHPELTLSACKYFVLQGDTLSPAVVGRASGSEEVRAMLLVTNPILHPGVIARREVMCQMRYDARFTCSEDLELWTRMAASEKRLALQDEYLMAYRLHGNQITATTLEKQHREVREIEAAFYQNCLNAMRTRELEDYLRGIYFRDDVEIQRFRRFCKETRRANREKKAFSPRAVDYALLEILAEYKRAGIGKIAVLRGLLKFSPVFLLRELRRRKRRVREDLMKSSAAALRWGMIPIPGQSKLPAYQRAPKPD